MRIRFTTFQQHPEGNFEPGQEVELRDDIAAALIEAGAAEPLSPEPEPEPEPASPEPLKAPTPQRGKDEEP